MDFGGGRECGKPLIAINPMSDPNRTLRITTGLTQRGSKPYQPLAIRCENPVRDLIPMPVMAGLLMIIVDIIAVVYPRTVPEV